MKPWEQTWEAIGSDLTMPPGAEFFGGDGTEADEANAKLAAAAPDMARALLAIEWRGGVQGDSGMCPSCSVFAGFSHAPNCALDAALRKAGVPRP